MRLFGKEFKRALQLARSAASGFKDWFLSLNAIKITALITLNCFLLTGVYGQAVAAITDNARATESFKQIFEDFDLGYSQGKITSAFYGASDTVVISIQDLHSHAGVQKNISKIIENFDKEFGVKNVYLEGAYGNVDTSWLLSIKDKALREKVLNEMLLSGRLTGAEYYSAISARTDIIKGLENKEEYFANLQRFGQILEMQEETKMYVEAMTNDIASLKSLYYSREQKKLETLSKQYAEGTISGKKYWTLLYKHTDNLGIDIYKYENIDIYKKLLERERRLDYTRITSELSLFIGKMKEVLPYSAYKMLLAKTNNFSDTDALYVSLAKISKEYNFNLSINYPQLEKFLEYIELSQKINPLELIKEEARLLDEINEKFSQKDSQRDIVFLAGFMKYLTAFLSSKITADEYEYYEANKEEFDALWVKYVDRNTISLIENNKNTAEAFYKVNIDRNKYFFDSIEGLGKAAKINADAVGPDEAAKVINTLKKAKNIYVIITGGFHTEAVAQSLSSHGISNIVITPNVSGGVQFAEEKYYQIAKEQSKILFQALAVLNLSQNPEMERLAASAEALMKVGMTQNDALEKVLNEEIIKDKEAAAESVKLLSEGEDLKLQITQKDGEKVTYSYNAKERRFVNPVIVSDSSSSNKAQMSVRSRNQVIKAASAASVLAAGATVALGIIFWPAAIAAFALAALSLGEMGFSLREKAKINKILKEQMSYSQTDSVDDNIKDKIFDSLSEKTRKKFGEDEASQRARFKEMADVSGQTDTEFLEFKQDKIYINPRVLSKLILDEALLETFIRHELRHKNFGGNFITRFIRSNNISWLEEAIVSFADMFDYIGLKVFRTSLEAV
ncbi:MAG: hypothetical protein LBU09_01785, partial [Endomicrobium sp.]|nr:hypothetical protein [Endomicrobium sp.]